LFNLMQFTTSRTDSAYCMTSPHAAGLDRYERCLK